MTVLVAGPTDALILADRTGGAFYPVRDPAHLLPLMREVSVANLTGVEILEGRERQTIREVPALGSASSRWLVHGEPDSRLMVRVFAPSTGTVTKSVILDRQGGLR